MIALDARQIGEFAGNALELSGSGGRLLALSARAAASPLPEQRALIERSARRLPLSVAGGSVAACSPASTSRGAEPAFRRGSIGPLSARCGRWVPAAATGGALDWFFSTAKNAKERKERKGNAQVFLVPFTLLRVLRDPS